MKYLIIFISFAICFPVIAQEDMERYFKLAEENNPELKASYAEYEAALQSIPQAKSLPDPQVMLGIFSRAVQTRLGPQEASLAITQSFPWFGTLKAQGNTAAINAESALYRYYDLRLKIKWEIQQSLNRAYFLNKSSEITTENLSLLTTFRELARVSFENDKTDLVSLLRIDMEEKELKTRLQLLHDKLNQELIALENIVGTSLEGLTLPGNLTMMELPMEKEFLIDSAGTHNPRVKSLEISGEAKISQARVASFMGKPSFTLGASYIAIGQRTDMAVPSNGRDAMVLPQIGMRIPIFRQKYEAMVQQSELEADNFRLRATSERLKLDTRISELVLQLEDANRRFNLYTELTDLAERSISLLETEFTTGETDFEKLILMEEKLLNYRLNLEKARVDNNNSIYEINYLIGR